MKKQKGQALILIALGIVVMIGFAALAIDGGNAFADRRHAQNAADTSALAGALAKVTKQDWQAAAFARAASNTYDNDGVRNIVTLHSPPIEGQYACAARPDVCNDYLQVIIVSNVDTWFARIVGMEQVTNRVSAVAMAKDQTTTQMYFGNAFVSLMPLCKSNYEGYPNDPFDISGNAEQLVAGSGLWVNSNCAGAFGASGGGTITIKDGYGITVVGGCNVSNNTTISPPPACNTGATQYQYPPTWLPEPPSCSTSGQRTTLSSGVFLYEPGNYTGSFPSNNGTHVLKKGVYCLDNFNSQSQNTFTTDVNNNGTQDASEGVMFFVREQVKITAQTTFNVRAMQDGPYKNLLIYLPLSNPYPNKSMLVDITAGSNSIFTGTILNPSGHCKLTGSGSTYGYHSQVVCFSVAAAGGSGLTVIYNDEENYDAQSPPQIELTQ